MLRRPYTQLLRGLHIATLLLAALGTLDTQSWNSFSSGILVQRVKHPYLGTKVKAQASSTPAAQLGTYVHKKEEQSKLRQTIESIKEDAVASMDDQTKQERKEETTAWRVVIYNDDIHSIPYVTESIADAIPQISREVAHTITMEAHSTGQATVLRTWQRKAELYCIELQKRGLTACAIHDTCPKQN
ncbi:ATP-dependent Clp protease adaptor protein ClpS family protein [Babesia bovis T2Bo]|uniref:ATP-dependent Clp protease adaptor protein ClpS family protein n=1 Tax=Babesia bovis T2Bo TaxID=484906 RepID=UPI001C350CCC|nr:ATP-dependent Clp protease adaptor protein ClpS family protein [Babesia bovis T2Bo]EDO05508.2 ATP-dependent Clp protease adaptor protein ClpS family protein [Babesia bovis T2Bo]